VQAGQSAKVNHASTLARLGAHRASLRICTFPALLAPT
jgi:hypothetical protein